MPAEAVLGIEIPEGDPDALRSAAGVWAGMGDKLEAQAAALDGAAGAVTGADWRGPASMSYSSTSSIVSFTYRLGAGSCRLAASAAKHHAEELEEAKADAKAALRDAVDANERMTKQRKVAAAAHADGRAALGRADQAAESGRWARVAGPAGAGAAAVADDEESKARGEAAELADAATHAERRASEAGEWLEEARERGRKANVRADEAAEAAARVYREVAGEVPPPPGPFPPAIPVSLRGASPALAGMGLFGSPFQAPGRYESPAQARAAQIAALRNAATDRERALEGGAADRFGGEFKGLTGFHLFGDPDTRGYQAGQNLGEVASWFPSPGTVANLLRKGGQRAAREFGEEGAEEAGETIRDRIGREAGEFRYAAGRGTRELRKKLGEPPVPKSAYDAHHLVPKGAYRTRNPAARAQLEEAQARMTRLGIGPDEAANGIYLRRETHRKTFGNDYFKAVNDRMKRIDPDSPTASKDAIRELDRIAREIERGQFP